VLQHNNLLNNILAKIEANNAGVDDAIMLDIDGFVAETKSPAGSTLFGCDCNFWLRFYFV
jgi:branched-subunit amino acid aminotransferase/4-amino-4-deoxychorismate lyase